MLVTVLGLRDCDAARVRRAVPGIDLRSYEGAKHPPQPKACVGLVVVMAKFAGHRHDDIARATGRPFVRHFGGITTLIAKLRQEPAGA